MATTAAVDVDAAVRFLKTLFGPAAPGFIGLWTLQTKESYWYKADLPDECARGVARFAPDSDLYVHLGLQAKPTRPIERGKETGVVAVPGLWLDLDYADAVHKKPNLPPNEAAARRFLDELPFPPTLVIHSGHGLQAYWLWRELWVFDDAAEHDQAVALGKRWTRFCREQAKRQGWDVDSTHDLARIFRIPGTLNHKDKGSPPRLVEVVTESEARYNPSDFEEFLPAYVAAEVNGTSAAVGEFVIDSGNPPPLEAFAAAMGATKFRKSWTRTRTDLQDQSGSGYDQSLANMAHMNGWTAQETVDLLCEAARKHGGTIKGRSYYEHTLAVAAQTEVIAREEPAAADRPETPVGPTPAAPAPEKRQIWQDGASFILDSPSDVAALWGRSEEVLMADGESLMIVGPSGAGKSTVAQQLMLGFCGLRHELFGFPILPASGNILYLAMDRPRQIRRSLQRMVIPEDRAILATKLRVWPGPLPKDPLVDPQSLVDLCDDMGVSHLFVDSLKDLAVGLNKDEIAGQVNRLFQFLMAAGIQVVIIHHQRKEQSDNKKPTKLADVYGNQQITSGAGSVVILWGEAGDSIVEFDHLKMPMSPVGPFRIVHDHSLGYSEIEQKPGDVLEIIRAAHNDLTAEGIARTMFGTEKPTRAQTERARRRAHVLENKGYITSYEEASQIINGPKIVRFRDLERYQEG